MQIAFHIIGPTDCDQEFGKLENVHVTGPYRESEVFDYLRYARCHLAFLPSILPETYMYTLSVTMTARLFTICYDIGAQAERIRAWGHGRVCSLASSAEEMNQTIIDVANRLARGNEQPPNRSITAYPNLLADYYGFCPEQRVAMGSQISDRFDKNQPHLATSTVCTRHP